MARFSLVAAVALALSLAIPVHAGDAEDAAFTKLWEDANKAPDKADFKAIRDAYVKTTTYQPYSMLTKEYEAVKKASKAKDYPAAIAAINVVLEKKPLDIDSQMHAAFLHSQGGDKTLEETHRAIAFGLGQAMMEGHDGTGFDQAFPVLAVDEEYFILKVLKVESAGHSLQEHNGHRYDVHTFKVQGQAEPREIYFDVTTPMNELGKRVDKLMKKAK